MLDTIRSYTDHTLIGIVAEGLPALGKSAVDAVVNHIALSILAQAVISFPLWYLHHNLFFFGLVIGFIWDEQVKTVVEKVNVVYNAKLSLLQRAFIVGGGGFFAILTMQMSLPIASFYYSAQWGALIYQYCLEKSPSFNNPPPSIIPSVVISETAASS